MIQIFNKIIVVIRLIRTVDDALKPPCLQELNLKYQSTFQIWATQCQSQEVMSDEAMKTVKLVVD